MGLGNDIPGLGDIALSPEFEWGDSRFNHISTTFLDDDVCTAVKKFGRDTLIRVDGVLALNGDSVEWTAGRSGMNGRNERRVENRRSRTRVAR
jgi:hypothetical protein